MRPLRLAVLIGITTVPTGGGAAGGWLSEGRGLLLATSGDLTWPPAETFSWARTIGLAGAVRDVLERKCSHAGIDVPTVETIWSSPFREEVEGEWENMLGHQLLKPLHPFADCWSTLDDVFAWLAGSLRIVQLPRAEMGKLDAGWEAPRAITSRHQPQHDLMPQRCIRYRSGGGYRQ